MNQNRKAKIELLNGILTGNRKISDYIPPQHFVFIHHVQSGMYYCEKLKKHLTTHEFQNFGQKYFPGLKVAKIVVKHIDSINRIKEAEQNEQESKD
jgi:thioredoxin-related protein